MSACDNHCDVIQILTQNHKFSLFLYIRFAVGRSIANVNTWNYPLDKQELLSYKSHFVDKGRKFKSVNISTETFFLKESHNCSGFY